MSKADLREALKRHGTTLQARADWLTRMVSQQAQTIENAQKTMQFFADELAVVERSIDELRKQYRELLNGD